MSSSKGRAPRILWLCCLVLLAAFALYEGLTSDLERQTFEFYALDTGKSRIEERMFHHAPQAEFNIKRYVEEALLGPADPESAPLFSLETRLCSLLLRDGTVYLDLSEAAALAPPGGDVLKSLDTVERGIRRNFPYVRNVYVFIEGNEVTPERRRRIQAGTGAGAGSPALGFLIRNLWKKEKIAQKGVDKT